MLKKLPLSLGFALFAFASFGQTIVSTSPENKKVVLEEFTGIHCVYCPQGHVIAQAIQDNNPDRAFLINIHTGSFANPSGGEPDFRTAYGTAIAGQTGLVGYPAATVNRYNFPGKEQGASGTTAMNRNNWTSAAAITLGQASNVNVAVEASIDVQTNILTVHVEGYYTSNSPEGTNLLNVALLQNNTKGPQTGGGQGNNYVHMHRLVEMITGQWGEVINTTTAGTFVDRTFTYTIPEMYHNVPVELADMEVVAFISNTHQAIPSGSHAYPTYTGLVNANDGNLRYVVDIPDTCLSLLSPQVNVQNLGFEDLTSLEIEYVINGESNTYNWTGNIESLRNETITLDGVFFDLNASNTITINLPNDDDNSNNTATTTFDKALDATTTIDMVLITDAYGSECRWNVKDYEGNILYNGGPYANNTTINQTFELPSNCYTFNIIDTYGDGGARATLTDSNNVVVFTTTGNYGSGTSKNFSTDGFVLGTNETQLENISLYPNPASTILNLRNAENASIQVYDLLGKMILSKVNISMDEQIDVANLQTGTYFMKISKDNLVTTKRFLISK